MPAIKPVSESGQKRLNTEISRHLVEIVPRLLTLKTGRPLVFLRLQQIVDET